MALSNYTELQASVASWMNRSDLNAQIPDFIAIAESNIADDVRVRQMLVEDQMTTMPGSGVVALPEGWLEFEEVDFDDEPLEYATANRFKADAKRWLGSEPCYYGIKGTNLLVGIGDVAATLDVAYYKRNDPLATTPTNFLLTSHPQIYLYGALSQAALFMIDDPRAATWGALYLQAVDKANGSSKKALTSGSPLRIRPR